MVNDWVSMILNDRDGYYWDYAIGYWCSALREEIEGAECPPGFDEGLMFILANYGPVEIMRPISRISLNEDGTTIEYRQL